MKLAEILDLLEIIAPLRHAESWDNVGLLTGDPSQEVTNALLTIDYTASVAAEARSLGCELVVAYHPPIFDALKRITAGSVVFDAIRRGVAIYSPHTALDVANGGTNDMLADAVGIGERRPLKFISPKSVQHKLVTFVPEDAVDKVSAALFEAGAGKIGKYTSCSFRTTGAGTFFGEEGAQPAVGQSGKLEYVQEVRVETVVPISKTEAVVAALRASHPYEEPAFDLQVLAGSPEGLGMGRIGVLKQPASRADIFERIKTELGIRHLLVAGPREGLVRSAAVCAGACGNHLDEAIGQRADLYVTGEIRHHDAVKAAAAGITVVCTLHSNSERAVLQRVGDRISEAMPSLKIHLSKVDLDPFEIV